jgi:hypothetical protein
MPAPCASFASPSSFDAFRTRFLCLPGSIASGSRRRESSVETVACARMTGSKGSWGRLLGFAVVSGPSCGWLEERLAEAPEVAGERDNPCEEVAFSTSLMFNDIVPSVRPNLYPVAGLLAFRAEGTVLRWDICCIGTAPSKHYERLTIDPNWRFSMAE